MTDVVASVWWPERIRLVLGVIPAERWTPCLLNGAGFRMLWWWSEDPAPTGPWWVGVEEAS